MKLVPKSLCLTIFHLTLLLFILFILFSLKTNCCPASQTPFRIRTQPSPRTVFQSRPLSNTDGEVPRFESSTTQTLANIIDISIVSVSQIEKENRCERSDALAESVSKYFTMIKELPAVGRLDRSMPFHLDVHLHVEPVVFVDAVFRLNLTSCRLSFDHSGRQKGTFFD